jgi:hypothetical protein
VTEENNEEWLGYRLCLENYRCANLSDVSRGKIPCVMGTKTTTLSLSLSGFTALLV